MADAVPFQISNLCIIALYVRLTNSWSDPWYFNKMVLQNTLRSDVSAILKSIHVREIVRMGEAMIDR